VFSELVRPLPPELKQRIVEQYYHPYRSKAEAQIAAWLARGHRVVHLSAHSFTPVLGGVARRADVGLLYDPRRPLEREFCRALQRELLRRRPAWVVRRNYPYRGAADGFTTHLRRRFAEGYLGIELELNQRWARSRNRSSGASAEIAEAVAACMARLGSCR
jgi:predicted N-formylglutamate amidohydrolase